MDSSDDVQSTAAQAETSFSFSGQPIGYIRIKGANYELVEHVSNIQKGSKMS